MEIKEEIQKREAHYHLAELEEIKRRLRELMERPEGATMQEWIAKIEDALIRKEILEARIEELRWVLELPDIS